MHSNIKESCATTDDKCILNQVNYVTKTKHPYSTCKQNNKNIFPGYIL